MIIQRRLIIIVVKILRLRLQNNVIDGDNCDKDNDNNNDDENNSKTTEIMKRMIKTIMIGITIVIMAL